MAKLLWEKKTLLMGNDDDDDDDGDGDGDGDDDDDDDDDQACVPLSKDA